MRRILIALSAVSVLAVAGCSSTGTATSSPVSSPASSPVSSPASSAASSPATSPASAADSIAGVTVTGAFGSEPTVAVNGVDATRTQSATLIKGDGAVVADGSKALLDIYLANGTTGQKAASTWDQGAPSSVDLVQGQVFPEFLNALKGVTVGSRVALVAPVSQLWGAQGNTQLGLSATDSVVFVIDVLSTPPANALSAPQGTTQSAPSGLPVPVVKSGKVTSIDFSGAPKNPPSKLQVVTLIKGDGAPIRKAAYATVNYFGEVWGSPTAFDESFTKSPVSFDVGDGHLIKGWDQGLVGVTAGSRVLMIIPPDYGYGSTAQSSIPANSTLVFVVDVLGVG